MYYRIGLDIGIGSIGWAVISGEKSKAHIENFGVNIFDSGELPKPSDGNTRSSQIRRQFRGARRLIRRRYFRKERLKAHFENINLIYRDRVNEYISHNSEDVHSLKVLALDSKLTPEQIAACLIHTCNHRGYRDFYEDVTIDDEEDKEASVNRKAVHDFDSLFKLSGFRTISEYLVNSSKNSQNSIEFRNRDSREVYLLIRRQYMQDEVRGILAKQSEYYKELTKNACEMIEEIIFSQRCFEDGPGDKNDKFRRYTGFLESMGNCPFYKEVKRGFRASVIGDVYSVINILSQYIYIDKATGERIMPKEAAREIVARTISDASMSKTTVAKILKPYGIEMIKSENSDDKALANSIKFLRAAKSSIESSGLDWEDFTREEQFDVSKPSKLHLISEVLSRYQTPSVRRRHLKSLIFMTDTLEKALSSKKAGGTAGGSNQYMCDAISAFCNGEIYGNFQAAVIENQMRQMLSQQTSDISSNLKINIYDLDGEIKDNPVVYKAINQTRKLVNAIINTYGVPACINVEVASELNNSYLERKKEEKRQRDNSKKNEVIKNEIATLLKIDSNDVTPHQVERYKLYRLQDGKCMYSGQPLGDLLVVLRDTHKAFEVDHIVPFSLILDNTLNNKALVHARENQLKGQKTPLMYLSGEREEQFKGVVNMMFKRKEHPISRQKYKYLMLDNIYSKEAEELLSQWKSRNINDTRYITKYVVSMLRNNLRFTETERTKVYGIKGALTSKFRRIWLNKDSWGSDEKNRDNYLTHAVDAVVIANLTPAFVEIASDNIKLQQIYKHSRSVKSFEYTDYMDKCIRKMMKNYGFTEEYTRRMLSSVDKVPSYVPNLRQQVDVRFNDSDPELFANQVNTLYGDCSDFLIKPHMPLTYHKPEKKFRGVIADSNPVKVRTIDGVQQKVLRKKISILKGEDIDKIYSKDTDLLATLKRIFEGKSEGYTVGDYLKEQNLTRFITDKGQPVYKVSVTDGKAFSSYYRKDIKNPQGVDRENYTLLGGLKYYCIEVYEDVDNNTCTRGIKMVDVIHQNKKLYLKSESLPRDYQRHIMYFFKNDFIKITNKKGEVKIIGYYKSVSNDNRSEYNFSNGNTPAQRGKSFSVAKKDQVKKYSVDLLGNIGGEIKCSVPLSLIHEKK